MSCLIQSDSSLTYIDFWNYYDFENNSQIPTKEIKRIGNGLIVNIRDMLYVITCYHVIENSNRIKVSYFDIKQNSIIYQNLIIQFVIEELDLAVLMFENYRTVNCELYDINSKISKSNPKLIVKAIFNNKLININAKFENISNLSFISSILANHDIPCINIKVNIKDVHGLSGGLLFNGNILIGMLFNTNQTDSVITAMPISVIMHFVYQKIIGGLVLNSQLCYIKMDSDVKYKVKFDKEECDGYLVEDIGKNSKLLKNDIIIQINNEYIKENGKIYSQILDYDIDYGTFALMNETLEIKYIRDNIVNSCILKSEISLPFHIKQYSNFVFNNGFVFTEMSEPLLMYYKQRKITILGDLNIFSNIRKYIVLVYVDYTYIKLKYLEWNNLKQIGFPNIDNKIFILNKIDNDVIYDLDSLKTTFNKKETIGCDKITFTFNNNSNSKMYILTNNSSSKMIKIKY